MKRVDHPLPKQDHVRIHSDSRARSRRDARLHADAAHERARAAGDVGRSSSVVAPHAPVYVAYVIFLVTVVNAFNYMDRMALAVLAPAIQADLGLSDGSFGVLTGFAFALFYAICGIPIARWADRGVRRDIMALALALWSLMTALSGIAQSFWHLFLARVGMGAGEAGGAAPAGSLLCDYVPLDRRPLVFAIQAFGFTAGMMLGMALAAHLGETIGWRWAFVVLGLPGLLLAAIVRFTLREPQRGVFDTMDGGKSEPLRDTLRFLLQCRTYRLLVLFLVVNGFTQYGLNQWWPSFYVRIFGLTPSLVGVYLGFAIGIGSAIGMIAGGLLSNHAARRDVVLPLRIGIVTIALAVPSAAASILVSSPWTSMCLVAFTILLLSVPFGAIAANVFSVVKPRMRAMAGAISLFVTSILGLGLGPMCVGVLSDLLAPSFGVQSLRYALLVPICLLPTTLIVLHAATKSLPHDLRRIGTGATVNEGAAQRS